MHKKSISRITSGRGWTKAPVGNTTKRHAYDTDSRSLCGRYALFAYRGDFTPIDPVPLDNGDLCAGCLAKSEAAIAARDAEGKPSA